MVGTAPSRAHGGFESWFVTAMALEPTLAGRTLEQSRSDLLTVGGSYQEHLKFGTQLETQSRLFLRRLLAEAAYCLGSFPIKECDTGRRL
jgi:hypothetical protein